MIPRPCILCSLRCNSCISHSDHIFSAIYDSSVFYHGLAATEGFQIFTACSLVSGITLVRAKAALFSFCVESLFCV